MHVANCGIFSLPWRCVLPDGFMAGVSADEDRARFHVTERGIVLITPEMLEQRIAE